MAEKPGRRTERNIKLVIAYDGTRFSGWQAQGNTPNTIQALVEEAIHKALGEKAALIGASRTDAGVHSNGQTANFKTRTAFGAKAMQAAINENLPSDVVVVAVEDMHERFHARYNAEGKTYCYKIWNKPTQNPFQRKYSLWIPEVLDLAAMNDAAAQMAGTKDFKAFSTGRTKKSTVKTLSSVSVSTDAADGMTLVTFRGDGFLYNMVRILTGTLIECGLGKRRPDGISAIFEAGEREKAGYTVPAHGLFLETVHYE